MTEWRDVTLGDVCELKRGYDLPKGKRKAGNVPVISSSGPTGLHSEAMVRAPGVVTGRYGTLGDVFYVTEDFWPLNTSLYVRDFKGNDPRYVAALLESMNLAQHDGAAAVPGLNRNQLHGLPVRVPDLGTQEIIAAILGALRDLLENNRRRIEVLDEMARAIYREWFVHFRYPGRVDSPPGATPNYLPAGWTARTLEECASALIDGDWVETKDQGGSGYRLLQVSNIAVGSFRETGKFRYVTQETFQRLRCTSVQAGDLLISRMPDPVGRAWLVDYLIEPAITVVDVAILRPLSNAMGVYLHQVINSKENLAYSETVATGTTRKRITRQVLGQISLVVPTPDLLVSYQEATRGFVGLASHLRRTHSQLAGLRDLLMPKLVTGQIDVSTLDLDVLVEDSVA